MEMVHCIVAHGNLSKEIQGAKGSMDFLPPFGSFDLLSYMPGDIVLSSFA